jgi:hypothetical protein
MITIETLSVAAPLLAAAAVGLFALATNYLDDKATRTRTKQTNKEKITPRFSSDPEKLGALWLEFAKASTMADSLQWQERSKSGVSTVHVDQFNLAVEKLRDSANREGVDDVFAAAPRLAWNIGAFLTKAEFMLTRMRDDIRALEESKEKG